MVDGKTLEQGKPQGHGKRQKLGDFGDTECKKRKGAEVGIIVGHAGPSHYRELDVRNWQRRELLLRFAPTFFCGSWKVDVFRPRAAPDKEWVTLSRIHRPSDLCHVRLKWTPCHYGGSRAWLLCPIASCGRRVAILYAGDGNGTIACRHCKLAYDTQRETTRFRDLYRAQKIRIKLGGSGSLGDPFPRRPKRSQCHAGLLTIQDLIGHSNLLRRHFAPGASSAKTLEWQAF